MVATQNDQSICDATSPSKSLTHSHVISVCIEFLVGQLQHVGLNGPRRNGCPEGAGSCVRAVQEQLESHLSVKITRRGDSLKHHGSNLDLILSQHIHRSMDGILLTYNSQIVSLTTHRPHLETSKLSHSQLNIKPGKECVESTSNQSMIPWQPEISHIVSADIYYIYSCSCVESQTRRNRINLDQSQSAVANGIRLSMEKVVWH